MVGTDVGKSEIAVVYTGSFALLGLPRGSFGGYCSSATAVLWVAITT
jgi:hypothetical protein